MMELGLHLFFFLFIDTLYDSIGGVAFFVRTDKSWSGRWGAG